MDVLQLADRFETFVEKSNTTTRGNNSLNSYSLPAFTCQAGLKLTFIKLDSIKE